MKKRVKLKQELNSEDEDERKGKEDQRGEDRFMDTGTGRSVGIGLNVLWYRVIVQRKNVKFLFKTANQKHLDPDKTSFKVKSSFLGSLSPNSPKLSSCGFPIF